MGSPLRFIHVLNVSLARSREVGDARLEAAISTGGSSDDDVVVLYKRVPPRLVVNCGGMASANGMSEDVREPPDRRLIEREGSPERPYPPTLPEPGFVPPDVPGKRVRCMDMNLYATKKSIAQGMMDIALLTANASQLKHLLHEGPEANRFYTLTVTCVALSITLQILVGVLLIFNGRYNINKTHQQKRAELFNNVIIIGVFLITVINIFVSAFSGPDVPRWSEHSPRLP